MRRQVSSFGTRATRGARMYHDQIDQNATRFLTRRHYDVATGARMAFSKSCVAATTSASKPTARTPCPTLRWKTLSGAVMRHTADPSTVSGHFRRRAQQTHCWSATRLTTSRSTHRAWPRQARQQRHRQYCQCRRFNFTAYFSPPRSLPVFTLAVSQPEVVNTIMCRLRDRNINLIMTVPHRVYNCFRKLKPSCPSGPTRAKRSGRWPREAQGAQASATPCQRRPGTCARRTSRPS